MNSEKKEKRQAQLAKKAETLKEYASKVQVTEKNELLIDGRPYLLIKNYRDGFQVDKLEERFSQILTKYDYIVGDWGFDQLRLHGFYSESNTKGYPSQSITHLQDYLYEYCNFGCAYFILKNLQVVTPAKRYRRRKKDGQRATRRGSTQVKNHNRRPTAKIDFEIHERKNKPNKKRTLSVANQTKTANSHQRHFTIRQKH